MATFSNIEKLKQFGIDTDSAPLTEAVQSMIDGFNEESDRGAALIAAAYFDNTLQEMLRARFDCVPGKPNKLIASLFESMGPMATFSGKIKLSFVFDLIDPELFADLEKVRKLRNEFAHELNARNFSDGSVKSLVNSMHIDPAVSAQLELVSAQLLLAEAKQTRLKFQAICSGIAGKLHARANIFRSTMPLSAKVVPYWIKQE